MSGLLRGMRRRKVERLKREALTIATPYMEHARDSLLTWRESYLRTKAMAMLDTFDERLVSLVLPDHMPFPDLLKVERIAFASAFVDGFENDMAKLRDMFGADTIEIMRVLEIESEVADKAAKQFQDVATETLGHASEAANAEAERRGLPGLILDSAEG